VNNNAFLISHSGTITLVVDSKTYAIGPEHVNYNKIRDVLSDGDYVAAAELADVSAAVKDYCGLTVTDSDQVFYGDFEIVGPVANRLVQFIRENLPSQPLINFIKNLMDNPSNRSVTELYGFLEHKGLPITEDGHFIAYKGIGSNWMDLYSGKFRNQIGDRLEMPRHSVDDDARNTCSHGFHVGSLEYASQYAANGRVVLVKVNPKDAVSVPADHDAQKLRVTAYEVIGESEKKHLVNTLYVSSVSEDDGLDPDFSSEEDDDYCENCGTILDDGDCFNNSCDFSR
jgi:hypothetical protein